MPYKIGEVVAVADVRGIKDCVIASTRYIRRGRYAGVTEYTLAPIIRKGKVYAHGCRGDSMFLAPSREYSAEEIQQALEAYRGTCEDITDRKEAGKERGRKAFGDWDSQRSNSWEGPSGTNIAVGDEVLVKYTNGPRWEVVGKISFKTGKVGINRRHKGYKTDVRWIHPDHIKDVRKPQSKLPQPLSDRHLEEMGEKGWTQIKISNGEFIIASYVISFTPEGVRKGNTYEAIDNTVYMDPELKVYWRSTGSWD